jgi:hypothetical protein
LALAKDEWLQQTVLVDASLAHLKGGTVHFGEHRRRRMNRVVIRPLGRSAAVHGPKVTKGQRDRNEGRAEHPRWHGEPARSNHAPTEGEPTRGEAAWIAAPQVRADASSIGPTREIGAGRFLKGP